MELNRETRTLLGVAFLTLSLLLGINFMIADEPQQNLLGWTLAAVLLAVVFIAWVWSEIVGAQQEAQQALHPMDDPPASQAGPSTEAVPTTPPDPPAMETAPEPTQAEAAPATEAEPEAPAESPEPPAVEAQTAEDSAATRELADFTRIEGIGDKYADALINGNVTTYEQLAAMTEDDLVELVKAAGMRRTASMSTWPEQAALAAQGDWEALDAMQEELRGGRRE